MLNLLVDDLTDPKAKEDLTELKLNDFVRICVNYEKNGWAEKA